MGNESSHYKETDWEVSNGQLLKNATETVDGRRPPLSSYGVYIIKKRDILNTREYDIYKQEEEDGEGKITTKITKTTIPLLKTIVPKDKLSVRTFDVLDGATDKPLIRVKPVQMHNGEWQFLQYGKPAFDWTRT